MPQPPTFGFLADPRMPLRDALRGVASLADATEDALEPAVNLLPLATRTRFRSALKSLENAGKRLMAAPVDLEDIQAASDFVRGNDNGRSLHEKCATVIVYAWEHLYGSAHGAHRQLISETLLFTCLSRMIRVAGVSSAEWAGRLVEEIRKSWAIGIMPGVVLGSRTDKRAEADLALVSIVVWLLSARADSMIEEEKLLDLSMAMLSALRAEVLESIEVHEKLVQLIESASEHL